MDKYLYTIITNVIPALFVAIITSIITVRLSIKQFYKQKWWEKKADTYSKIIEELSYMQFYFSEIFDEGINIKKLSEEDRKEFKKKYKKSKQLIFKSYAAGSYIISSNSIKALERLIKELEEEKMNCHFVENYDRWYGATKDCIKTIREEAKKDLKK